MKSRVIDSTGWHWKGYTVIIIIIIVMEHGGLYKLLPHVSPAHASRLYIGKYWKAADLLQVPTARIFLVNCMVVSCPLARENFCTATHQDSRQQPAEFT